MKSRFHSAALTTSALLIAGTAQAAETVTLQYDELGRLISTNKSGGPVTGTAVTTSYDPAGNRENQTVNGAPGGASTQPTSSPAAFSVTAPFSELQQPGTARFSVIKSGLPAVVTSINFQTVAGSAQPASDYTAQMGTLSFRNWETIKFVEVPVLSSGQAEPAETFSLLLSSPSSGASIVTSSAIATIAAIGPPNQPPVTVADLITVSTCLGSSINVLTNDSDPESGALTLVSVTPALSGLANVALGSSAGLVLVTGSGSAGADQATYVASDPQGATSSGILAITIQDNGGCSRRAK